METHPERIFKFFTGNVETCKVFWDNTRDIAVFKDRFSAYLRRAMSMPFQTERQKKGYSSVMFWPVLEELMQGEEQSFTAIVSDPRYAQMAEVINVLTGGMDQFGWEELSTANLAFFHLRTWELCGRKIYDVTPDLFWALCNTELKGFPVEGLHVPFQSFYLKLPSSFQVWNRVTNWHEAEGVYIFDDYLRIPRCWRFMVIGKSKNDDLFDDALFHWQVTLPEGAVADECIEKTIEIYDRMGPQEVVRYKDREVPVEYLTDDSGAIFRKMKEVTRKVFAYAMNVALYATSAESDAAFYAASKEYRDLRDRAMKAQGEKRKELFTRLKGMNPYSRILLGGKIIIDRKKEAGDTGDGGEGRRQRVRSLVSGHRHHYWTGPKDGERKLIVKWIRPYWRGPEYAPVTQKEVMLK